MKPTYKMSFGFRILIIVIEVFSYGQVLQNPNVKIDAAVHQLQHCDNIQSFFGDYRMTVSARGSSLWLLCCIFASLGSAQISPMQPSPKTALAEPDFFAAGGATITLRGRTYTITLVDVLDGQGSHDHYAVGVSVNGGPVTSYASQQNANRPVNDKSEGIQIFLGTPGDDVLVPDGSTGWNGLPVLMFGFAGDDILIGTDSRGNFQGTSWGDAIFGGTGNDNILGLGGEDFLWGGADDDGIVGGDDDDNIMGGDGHDQLDFSEVYNEGSTIGQRKLKLPRLETSDKNQVTLTIGTDFPDPFASPTQGRGLLGYGGDDHIWGEAGTDFIYGDKEVPVKGQANRWPGTNYLDGGGEGDFIFGGEGVDTVFGGAGDDTIVGGKTIRDLVDDIVAGDGLDTVDGGAAGDHIWGGLLNDTLHSFLKDAFGVTPTSDGTNFIDGEDGNDVIRSSLGSDRMLGGAGDDTIHGGLGGDNTIVGEDGNDTITVSSGTDTISGGDGNDTISCLGGSNAIWGGVGLDVIRGGTGQDFIHGGDGNDRLFGDSGVDRIVDIDTWFNILDGGEGDDELNCFDGNLLFSWDEARGGLGNDVFWADEFSADATSMGDDLPDYEFLNPNEFWLPHPLGPTTSWDGRTEPAR